MKCVICHGQDIERRPVQEEIRNGDDIVRIPLDVLVCVDCGERYYNRESMRYLETIREKVKHHELDLTEVGKVLACKG